MTWWSIGLKVVSLVLGWFGYGGGKDERDTERAAGEKLGQSETNAESSKKELDNARKADDAGTAAAAADDAGGVRDQHPGDKPWNPDGLG